MTINEGNEKNLHWSSGGVSFPPVAPRARVIADYIYLYSVLRWRRRMMSSYAIRTRAYAIITVVPGACYAQNDTILLGTIQGSK